MPYSDDALRECISDALAPVPGKKQSGLAIMRELNMYLDETGRANRKILNIDSADRRLREFAKGRPWTADTTKKLLWEMYVDKKRLLVFQPGTAVTKTVDNAHLAAALTIFLGPATPEFKSLSSMEGSFSIFKRSIADSEMIVRGYLELSLDKNDDRFLSAKETHVNRSYRDMSQSELPVEYWNGVLTPRYRCYCLVNRESILGTPKFSVFSPAIYRDGKVMTATGYCIESVENWSRIPQNNSGIYLERTDSNFLFDRDIDIFSAADISRTHPHIMRNL